jgi:hypothetical protein
MVTNAGNQEESGAVLARTSPVSRVSNSGVLSRYIPPVEWPT